jgi:hypothetical protein
MEKIKKGDMIPYRFNPFEMDLLKRLSFNVYLKNNHFEMNRWPVIYWGDFDRSIDGGNRRKTSDVDERIDSDYSRYDIDLLGCYLYSSNEEGYIEIYGNRIHECAKDIAYALNLDFEITRRLLQTIVLLHEIGHWFSHGCFKEYRNHRMYVFTHQTKEIKETIAQLSVMWSVLGLQNKKVKSLLEIMSYLSQNQSWPYRQYLKMGNDYKKKSTILNRYVNLLDLENSDLNYLLLKNKRPDPYRRF